MPGAECGWPSCAGVYDEKVLVGLDFAINEASKRGIRVVPVFANYWAMYGGIDQYNTWSFEAGSGEMRRTYQKQSIHEHELLL